MYGREASYKSKGFRRHFQCDLRHRLCWDEPAHELAQGRAPLDSLLVYSLRRWAVWHAQSRLTPEACWNEVAPGLSRRPLRGEHPPAALVIDMTAEFPKPRYHPASAAHLCLPTLDAFTPEPAAFASALEEAAAEPSVFVPCANGRGRSAAFAAALLMRKGLAGGLSERESRRHRMIRSLSSMPNTATLAAAIELSSAAT